MKSAPPEGCRSPESVGVPAFPHGSMQKMSDIYWHCRCQLLQVPVVFSGVCGLRSQFGKRR